MRCEPWMNQEERTPEQIRQDRLRTLQHEKTALVLRLDRIRSDMRDLGADIKFSD